MPPPRRDGLRSAVYRSFVFCGDPKGVAHCKSRRIKKSKNQDMAMALSSSVQITEVVAVSDCIANRDVSNLRGPEASRDCCDELREVISESFARQDIKGMYCGDREDLDLLPSSSSSIRAGSSERNSPSEVLQVEKPKAGNLIAKLMGLDEVVMLAEEKLSSNQISHLLDIDLLARPRSVVRKVVGERLRKPEETMQYKGIVSQREGKCQPDLSLLRKMLAIESRPPIVVMRPRRVREEFPAQVPKGREMVTETNEKYRVERTNNRKINREKEGRVHFGESRKKDRDKLPTKKINHPMSTTNINHPKPLVPRVHKNEAVATRIDHISPKLASNTRKQAVIKGAKNQDQGNITTLKLISRTTRDSNVSKGQKATPENKMKPRLSLSSIPNKNLRKAKPDRKPTDASVENIQNEGSLPINIESSITQDSMMNSCYVSTSDKNDMKCVEDGTCIPGHSVDDANGWESIYNTRRFLLSSASFLSLAEELFDVGTCDTEILRTPSLHDSEMPNGSPLLDCAVEILERKSTLRWTWALNPSSQNLLKSPKRRLSLRQLVGEISDGIEILTNYNKSCSGAVHADRIYSMLETDLWWNEEVTGAWDLGWKTGNDTEDVNRVVHDLEELVLREIVADVVIEFKFG